jgi:SnoaL-like domain
MATIDEIEARLAKVEDDVAIRRLVASYGPSVDSGFTGLAADGWLPDGVYDWDAVGAPYPSSNAIDDMLKGDGHQGLIAAGVAHFHGPPLIDLDGDVATALTYSVILRRDVEAGTYYLWRISAARWDLERSPVGWRIRRRTHRLIDESGVGRQLFGETLAEIFPEGKL